MVLKLALPGPSMTTWIPVRLARPMFSIGEISGVDRNFRFPRGGEGEDRKHESGDEEMGFRQFPRLTVLRVPSELQMETRAPRRPT